MDDISCLDAEVFFTARAMLRPREREGAFWFSTDTSSRKVQAFRRNPKAGAYFVDSRFFRGASLSGTVEVPETAAAGERIWRLGDTMYDPKGGTDPDYCVLKFTAQRAGLAAISDLRMLRSRIDGSFHL